MVTDRYIIYLSSIPLFWFWVVLGVFLLSFCPDSPLHGLTWSRVDRRGLSLYSPSYGFRGALTDTFWSTMTDKLFHLDIFPGFGWFMKAAKDGEYTTIAICETDPQYAEILAETYPEIPNLGNPKYLCRDLADQNWDTDLYDYFCPFHRIDYADCKCIGTQQYIDNYPQPHLITADLRQGRHKKHLSDVLRITTRLHPEQVIIAIPSTDDDLKLITAEMLEKKGYGVALLPINALHDTALIFAHKSE